MTDIAPTAIDLFSGAGGLSLGLKRAGFSIRAAVDNDPRASATYAANLGDYIRCTDIGELEPGELLEHAGLQVGECTLLAGGPPCQGFSLQRRGDRKDSRNHLILEFIRFVTGIRPRFFIIENVRGLNTKHGRPFVRKIVGELAREGYHTRFDELNALWYGVPQQRLRRFLVGELVDDEHLPTFRFPAPELDERRWRTVRDAIGDLPAPPEDGSPHPGIANHFREGNLSSTNLERIRHIPEGGGREHLPEHLRLPCHMDNPDHRHLDVYGRLAWDKPSVTITARFDSFTRGKFGHPEQHRSVTLREGARLQSFPDDFVFFGSREDIARQIGNAVPPELAYRLGLALLAALDQEAAFEFTTTLSDQLSFI